MRWHIPPRVSVRPLARSSHDVWSSSLSTSAQGGGRGLGNACFCEPTVLISSDRGREGAKSRQNCAEVHNEGPSADCSLILSASSLGLSRTHWLLCRRRRRRRPFIVLSDSAGEGEERGAVFADSRACKQFLDVGTVSPTRLCRRKRGTTSERTNGRYFGEWWSAVICCRHLFKLRALQASNRYRI